VHVTKRSLRWYGRERWHLHEARAAILPGRRIVA
jgi:hypothetical protein